MNLRGIITLVGRETLKIVLPSPCVVCGGDLGLVGRRASCCASCWGTLPRIDELRCRRCALPWSGGVGETFLCLECARRSRDPLDWIDSWGHYRAGLEKVLHAFKFERHDFLAVPLGELIAEVLEERGADELDALVPVPLHPKRLRERGYNQAELLAVAASKRCGLPVDRRAIRKKRDQPPQATLRRGERAANVSGAFEATRRLDGQRLLLIDDICTTGATLRACARALRKGGAERVAALAVARA
ncbi:MAG TPA: ComF family protein [Thermoanaerobaculia bacterium]|nr:ComF family protein [Thermoanaerobaculia bacterium]